MVKANVERGSGFRGVVNYAFGDGKGAEIVGGNMVGTDPRSLAQEFALSRESRSEVQRPVWHCSLSCPPGEVLSAEEWDALTSDFMRIMELDAHQFVAIRHTDTAHDHVHIVASRIRLDGELWHGQWEARKAIAATQRLEREHGLTLTPGLEDIDVIDNKRAPTKPEIEQADRTGEAPARLRLQDALDSALEEPGSVFAFMDQLEAAGVTVRPNVASTGRLNGFSFEIDGIPFKGSQLGKAYSWKQLQARGIEYEQDRDGEALRARADAARAGEDPQRGGEPARPDAGDGRFVPEHGPSDRREPGRDAGGARGVREEREAGHGRDPHGERGGDAGGDRGAPGREIDTWSAPDDAPHHARSWDDGWRGVSDRVADLAAPAHPEPVAGQSRPVSAAVAAKRRAWERQHGALQAPAYRLTLKSQKEGLSSFNYGKERGDGDEERFYSAEEVADLIPYLSRENVLGRDIYVTPIDDSRHYLVVDDMTPETEAGLIEAGYRPALIQESSSGNRQAIIITPRDRSAVGSVEQSIANQLVGHLNQRFGDPKFSGVVHPFRMSGFSNKKPGRGDAFTRIIHAAGGICEKALRQLEGLRERWREAAKRKAAQKEAEREGRRQARRGALQEALPAPRPTGAPQEAAGVAHDRFRALHVGLVTQKGWSLDESRVDYRVALDMLADGWSLGDVTDALRERSPNIEVRHRDPDGYARRTADRANGELERQRTRGIARDDGPTLG